MAMPYSEARGYFTAAFWQRHVQLIDDSDDLTGPNRTTKKRAEIVAQARFGGPRNIRVSTMLLLTKFGVAKLAEECRGRQDEYRQCLQAFHEQQELYQQFQDAEEAHDEGTPWFDETGDFDVDNANYQAARIAFEQQCEIYRQLGPQFEDGGPHQPHFLSTFYFTFEQRGATNTTPGLGPSPRERSQLGNNRQLCYAVRQAANGVFQICHLSGMV